MQGVFVSYRRQDSQSAAGRLSDHLKEHLRGVPIFRDVETIEPGVDFVDAIERALNGCGVLLAVIGPRWIDAQDASGNRRLDDANDYTRLEIARALKRDGVRVIPVLVEGAEMPATDQLPDDLDALARRNAIELTDKRWDFDVSQLVVTVRKVLGLPDQAEQIDPAPPDGPASKKKWWIGGAVALLAIAGLVEEQGSSITDVPDPVHVASTPPVTPAVVTQEPAATVPRQINLSGIWRDVDGGTHEIMQRGNEIAFQGQTPDGYVMGTGSVSGLHGQTRYTLNGYPLQSTFNISSDGSRIDVSVRDPATGEQYASSLVRVR